LQRNLTPVLNSLRLANSRPAACRAQFSALTGTIPDKLCGPNTQLRVLNLRSNLLLGPSTPVEKCTQLTQLDLGSNRLTGTLPATRVRLRCWLRVSCAKASVLSCAAALALTLRSTACLE
jgi:hypothetical protein